MNFHRRLSLIFAAFAVVLTFVFAASAQKVGGYKEISKDDARARAAAAFAVSTAGERDELEIELLSIREAGRQTVAGANFRLCLKVSAGAEDEAGEIMTVLAVVFQDLKGAYRLSSWKQEDCGSEDEDDDN